MISVSNRVLPIWNIEFCTVFSSIIHCIQAVSTSSIPIDSDARVDTIERKRRTIFSNEQLEALKNVFNRVKYPGSVLCQSLATKWDLSERSIRTWFHNQRMKQKKIRMSNRSTSMLCESSNLLLYVYTYVNSNNIFRFYHTSFRL